MAKRGDNLREAVERTVEATLGSAERGRTAAQSALDDLRSMAGSLEGRRPATHDDVKEIRKELRAIARRLDRIEERLPGRGGSKS